MKKKKYSTDQLFYSVFAVNSRKDLLDSFTIEKLDHTTLGLYDTIIDKNGELSDGEVALALSESLNNIYGDGGSNTYVSLINWWPI